MRSSQHFFNSTLLVYKLIGAPTLLICHLSRISLTTSSLIKELHWLPVLARVRYKILLLVAKSQQGLAPKYLCDLMYKPLSARSFRPLLLIVVIIPWSRTSLSQNLCLCCGGSFTLDSFLLHSGV